MTAQQYVRPLGAYLTPALAAGLQVDAVVDGEPSPACATGWPEAYEKYRVRPLFLAIRARRLGGTGEAVVASGRVAG